MTEATKVSFELVLRAAVIQLTRREHQAFAFVMPSHTPFVILPNTQFANTGKRELSCGFIIKYYKSVTAIGRYDSITNTS